MEQELFFVCYCKHDYSVYTSLCHCHTTDEMHLTTGGRMVVKLGLGLGLYADCAGLHHLVVHSLISSLSHLQRHLTPTV